MINFLDQETLCGREAFYKWSFEIVLTLWQWPHHFLYQLENYFYTYRVLPACMTTRMSGQYETLRTLAWPLRVRDWSCYSLTMKTEVVFWNIRLLFIVLQHMDKLLNCLNNKLLWAMFTVHSWLLFLTQLNKEISGKQLESKRIPSW